MTTLTQKLQCERCPAVEETAVSYEDIKSGKFKPETGQPAPKYVITVGGKTVASYTRLCKPCVEAVEKAISDIATKRTKKVSKRG